MTLRTHPPLCLACPLRLLSAPTRTHKHGAVVSHCCRHKHKWRANNLLQRLVEVVLEVSPGNAAVVATVQRCEGAPDDAVPSSSHHPRCHTVKCPLRPPSNKSKAAPSVSPHRSVTLSSGPAREQAIQGGYRCSAHPKRSPRFATIS